MHVVILLLWWSSSVWHNGNDLFIFFKSVSVCHCKIHGMSVLNICHPYKLSTTFFVMSKTYSFYMWWYKISSSVQATEHMMKKWKYPSPLNREDFLKFQQVFLFPFSGGKVVLTRCRCYTRSILSKKKSWKRSLGILFFPNTGWITACLSLLLLVLCSDNLNLKFRFFHSNLDALP